MNKNGQVVVMRNFDPAKVEINLEVLRSNNKPKRAMWSSSLIVDENGLPTSDWERWLNANDDYCWRYDEDDNFVQIEPPKREKYIFLPKKGLRIYEVNELANYASSCLEKAGPVKYVHEIENVEKFSEDWYSALLIDYEAMRRNGWDGIHFSASAARLGHNWATEETNPCVAQAKFVMEERLSTIDCESTVWLRPDWYEDYARLS